MDGPVFKTGYTAFKDNTTNPAYPPSLKSGNGSLRNAGHAYNLDYFILADALWQHRWLDGEGTTLKLEKISQLEITEYIAWIKELVLALRPQLLLFCGGLTHVMGTMHACKRTSHTIGLCAYRPRTITKDLDARLDGVINRTQGYRLNSLTQGGGTAIVTLISPCKGKLLEADGLECKVCL